MAASEAQVVPSPLAAGGPAQAPQRFLDPRTAEHAVAGAVHLGMARPTDAGDALPAQLPWYLRSFGFLPDTTAWRPGDLILVCAVRSRWRWRLIQAAQQVSVDTAEHARWHHAAVYLGDFVVAEAVGGRGVRVGYLYPYLSRFLLRVRRPLEADAELGQRLALQAAIASGKRYDWRGFWRLGAQAIRRRGWRRTLRDLLDLASRQAPSAASKASPPTHPTLVAPPQAMKPRYICSDLYADCYYLASNGRLLVPPQDAHEVGDDLLIDPAVLSASPRMVDIDVGWLRLPAA